jgi:hypothetical protein
MLASALAVLQKVCLCSCCLPVRTPSHSRHLHVPHLASLGCLCCTNVRLTDDHACMPMLHSLR